MVDDTRVIVIATYTIINLLVLVINGGFLATIIKLYTEILKIGHIKNIGKKDV